MGTKTEDIVYQCEVCGATFNKSTYCCGRLAHKNVPGRNKAGIVAAFVAVLMMLPVVSQAAVDKTIEATVKGTMTSSLSVTDQVGDPMEFKVDNQTKYLGFDKLSDLQSGDRVGVQYRENYTEKTATVVSKTASAVPANPTSQGGK